MRSVASRRTENDDDERLAFRRTGMTMNRLGVIGLFALFMAAPAWAQSPDTILVNGKILTVDAQSSVREALAVRDGRIVALGTSARDAQAGRPAVASDRSAGPDRHPWV